MIKTKKNTILTEEFKSFIDLTDEVIKFVKKSEIRDGTVTVYVLHTTSGIRVMENEVMLKMDLNNFLERLGPKDYIYYHDDLQKREVPKHERINAYSHLRTLVLNTNETVPIVDGKVILGEWQRIMYIECDPGRERTYFIQVIGNG